MPSKFEEAARAHGLLDRLLESTMENAPDAVFWVDRSARIFRVNATACRMHGYDAEAFARLSVFDLTGEYENTDWDGLWAKLNHDKRVSFESHHLRRDGTRFPVEATIIHVVSNRKECCACFIRDITARKKAEERLLAAHAEVSALKERLARENVYLRGEIDDLGGLSGGIVTEDAAFQGVIERARRVAPTGSTVLLLGETGTGKELFARMIHESSPRRDRPLVKVNCAALPASLIESELFGHEKGAFSGAVARRRGRFELADGGTLFLDEIGELPAELQPKLLRVLQDGVFERVGATESIEVDTRLVAATNRDLAVEAAKGAFREDLYFRLSVFPLHLPPLRERAADIGPLVRHFIEKHRPRTGSLVRRVAPRTLDRLKTYSWPGNVRELENIVERALILSTGETLDLPDFPERRAETPAPAPADTRPEDSAEAPPRTARQRPLKEMEKEAIREALAECNGIIEGPKGAAARLQIAPSTLRDRIRRHGLG